MPEVVVLWLFTVVSTAPSRVRFGGEIYWQPAVPASMRPALVVSQRYLSIAEAADYLGISTTFVRNLIAEGEIRGYRIGSHPRGRTPRVDLDEIDGSSGDTRSGRSTVCAFPQQLVGERLDGELRISNGDFFAEIGGGSP